MESPYILLPHEKYTEDLFILADGTKANATLTETVIKQSKLLNEEQMLLYKRAKDILSKKYEHWHVPTFIYYNSGIQTITEINLTGRMSIVEGNGDLKVPSKPLEMLIKQWQSDEPNLTTFKDAKSDDKSKFSHFYIERNPEVARAFYQYINE